MYLAFCIELIDQIAFLNTDEGLDINEAGATTRNSETKPFCNSEEHKTIGLGHACKRPICNSEDHKAIGIAQRCNKPVCNTEVHKAIGLGEPCIKPICNSEDHKEAGLEQECSYYCNSEEHNKVGNFTQCIFKDDSNTLVPGRALNNAWMYDGDFWNDVQPLSIPRDRTACTLVQAKDGVSFKMLTETMIILHLLANTKCTKKNLAARPVG